MSSLSSSNGVTLDGMLVNIDGTGNRVAAMAWARNRIIFVVASTRSVAIYSPLPRG
jgi:hypothetical protein